ncbi:hypothetical protein RND81_09G171200 [Saponaria officinalis]|uniref:Glycosyl transferase CAP10 domain-containing protein n=1 Tax=Saponaria officinalis TaxID=3572 RepID=A0AAW1INE0_SAPOF
METMNGNFGNKSNGFGLFRQFIQSPARSSLLLFFLLSLFVGAFLSTRFLDSSPILITSETVGDKPVSRSKLDILLKDTDSISNIIPTPRKPRAKIEFPLKCSDSNVTQTCPTNYPEKADVDPKAQPPSTCPDYFRWIHEDLRPWREVGITRETLEMAKRTAEFKLVILNGKAYVEILKKSDNTRGVITRWGILQLLRRYPGRVPDLELMFDTVDLPVISKHYPWPNATAPPLFRYCGDANTFNIVFPDWTFWGWAEINIKPWNLISKEIKEGNKMIKYSDRGPYAYWKGNPFVAPHRMDLLKCNVSDEHDWGARIFIQDWIKEGKEGFKQSNLAKQCNDRYKIYIEGTAWSVSEKYILACDSLSLRVKPKYYNFFARSMMPTQHYWPIRVDNKCPSIKFAVEWGNSHTQKAQEIGKAASDFILEDVKMDYVYDYMLHLLTEYAKLLKFKPTIPKNAVDLCSETMACNAVDRQKQFMMESLVKSPSDELPCIMPSPYDRVGLLRGLRRKDNAEKQVQNWEKSYWNNQTRQQ